MAKKQILTNDNICTDIAYIIKHPTDMSRTEYQKKTLLPIMLFCILMMIAMVIFQNHFKLILLVSLIFIIMYLVFDYFRQKSKIKNLSIDNFEVKKEVVSYVKEEIYHTDRKGYVRKKLSKVQVYIMRFENGEHWNIPKNNYTWSGEYPMSDDTIYKNTHFGDLFWIVTNKSTGEIVMAYPCEYFEYKTDVI